MKKYASLFLLMTALAGCRNAPPSYEHAADLVAKGEFSTARIELMNLLQQNPADMRALGLMAQIQLAGGDGMGAENSLQRIAARQPLNAMQRGQLAEAMLLQDRCDKVVQMERPQGGEEAGVLRVRILCAVSENRPEEAKALAGEAATRFPSNGPLTVTRGRLALLSGDLAEARTLSAAATKLLPRDFDAALLSGQVALAQGDYTGALAGFDRAAKANPVSIAPLFAKGTLLAELKQKAELDAVIAQAEKIGPGRGEVHLLRAEAAMLGGDVQTAQNEINAARKTLPGNPALRMLDAQIASKLGNDGIAIKQLTQLIDAQPGYARARLLLAQALARSGDAAAAAKTLRPAAERPDAPREYVAAMASYAKAANLPDADSFALRAQHASPQRLANALVEADAAMQRRDWRGAALRYEALLAETGRPNAVILNNLGWAQFELGETDKAIATLKKAVAAAPTNASARDSHGWVLWKSGKDRTEGLNQLRKAAEIAPNNKAIAAHLAEAGG